jgi:peptidoglycan/LPS O-acetylase OafA/YrhL
MALSIRRFEVLDSFRGIAALMVAIYHFMIIDIYSLDAAKVDSEFVNNLWLFTDFFFVLSGFILSYRYYRRRTPFAPLLIARLYRLFPLHIFTTIIFVGLMLYVNVPYTALIPSFFLNIANLHIFFPDLVTLNAQSWSISAEFYFSIILGAVFLTFPRHILAISVLVVCNIWHWMDAGDVGYIFRMCSLVFI